SRPASIRAFRSFTARPADALSAAGSSRRSRSRTVSRPPRRPRKRVRTFSRAAASRTPATSRSNSCWISRTRLCTSDPRAGRRPQRARPPGDDAPDGLLGGAEGALGGLRQGGEPLRVGRGQIGQDLPIDRDAGLPQAGHQAAVRQAVLPRRGVDADDPQTAELALASASIAIGVAEGLLDRLLGGPVQLALAGVVPLRQLEHLLASVSSLGSS